MLCSGNVPRYWLLCPLRACCSNYDCSNCALCTFALLRLVWCSKSSKRFEQSQSKHSDKSLIIQDLVELYYILCNHVWGNACNIPCVYAQSITYNWRHWDDILHFCASRFATLLLLVSRVSRYNELALALAVCKLQQGVWLSLFCPTQFYYLQYRLDYLGFRLAYFTQSPSALCQKYTLWTCRFKTGCI